MTVPGDARGYYIGVDLGGSLTKIAISDRSGALLNMESIGTEGVRGPGHVVRRIAATIDRLLRRATISRSSMLGVGIGSPGPLDRGRGTIVETPNLGWKDVPLRDMVADAVQVRTALDNDANAAALGEWWKGAGAGVESLVCLTLGTGVGGGIVIGGEIWHGISDVAGEIGHMTIEVDGRPCNCGNRGCLEAYASATAIAARAREGIANGRTSALKEEVGGDLLRVTSEMVSRQAAGGDPFCLEIMAETARYLGVGVSNVLNVINPEVIAIAGGVTRAGDLLFGPLMEEVGRRAFPAAVRGARIVPAELGTVAGVVGAVGVIKKDVEGSLVS